MPETTPLIKAALNLRGGAGFDVYEKRMSGNTQKEEIYRTAMRICRMWGVAETLDGEIPPYENPKTPEILIEMKSWC